MVGAAHKRTATLATASQAAGSRSERHREAVVRTLLRWYDAHRRSLPWRMVSNPYATWISEIMLQQTQVAAVVPYFERWMKLFPTVAALAGANADAVLSAWQGLGYYSRARNLHQSAQRIQSHYAGRLPSDPRLLRQLPGIGRYTAGAIASIAFDLPEPAVDGNVLRVVTRLEALRGDPRVNPVAARVWRIAADWVRCQSPGRVNQALMELGALICIPENPRCGQCPLIAHCRAYRRKLTDVLPESRPRPKPEVRRVAVLVARRGDSVLVLRQPASARHWANLHVLPHVEHGSGETARCAATRLLTRLDPQASLLASAPTHHFTYPITRFRFEATAFLVADLRATRVRQYSGRYATAAELAHLALPAPHRRLCELLRRADNARPN